MDPVTAVGLASAVIQLVDFGSRVLAKSVEVYKSAEGATRHDADMAYVVAKFQNLNVSLKQPVNAASTAAGSAVAPSTTALSAPQQAVCDLAAECSGLSDDILAALAKIQARSGHRVWRSVRTALKSVWSKEKIDAMKAKFDDVKNQLQFGVLVEMSLEIQILRLVQSKRFDELSDHMQRLMAALAQSSDQFIRTLQAERDFLDAQFQETRSIVADEGQKTRSTVVDDGQRTRDHFDLSLRQIFTPAPAPSPSSDSILQRENWLQALHASLHYDTIDARQDAIKPRHKETFEWIFDENKKFSATGPNFVEWLRSHGGIYWISGKAGSGKSTLMNFMIGDDRLRQALEIWAQGSEVVTASFFFWKSGTDLQKSTDGLLRSILFQVLDDSPALIDTVLGLLYKPLIAADKFHWSTRKLQDCFERLLSQSSFKVCLFIDGLDEFVGEHLEIVELLQRASALSSTKICLSSRPWVIFERAFSTLPRLRVQELTEPDIIVFVQDKLQIRDLGRDKYPWKRNVHQNIANTIINKAEGVFIWVETVVRSIQRGYFSEDSPELLLARLRALPAEILDLYLPMLKQVEEIYRDRQYRILESMRFGHSEVEPRDFNISTLFMQCMEDDSDHIKLQIPLREISAQANMINKRRAKAQIEACCVGLIEVDERGYLSFSHQTVMEFLNRPATRNQLQEGLSVTDFNPARAYLSAIISLINQGFIYHCYFGHEVCYLLRDNNRIDDGLMLAFTTARWLESSENCSEETLLDKLDQVVWNWYQSILRREHDGERLDLASFESWKQLCWHAGIKLLSYNSSKAIFPSLQEYWSAFSAAWKHPIPRDFLGLAAQHNLQQYVSAKINSRLSRLADEPWVTKSSGPSQILFQIFRSFFGGECDPDPAFVQILLRHGADPNARYGAESAWAWFLLYCVTEIRVWQPEIRHKVLNICEILVQQGAADLASDLWINYSWISEHEGNILFARISVVNTLVLLLKDTTSYFVEEKALLESIAKSQGQTVCEFLKSAGTSSVVEARVVHSRATWIYHAFNLQAVIADDSHLISDVDAAFAGGPLSEETVETFLDLTNGWNDRRFCGRNAERAMREMGRGWSAMLDDGTLLKYESSSYEKSNSEMLSDD